MHPIMRYWFLTNFDDFRRKWCKFEYPPTQSGQCICSGIPRGRFFKLTDYSLKNLIFFRFSRWENAMNLCVFVNGHPEFVFRETSRNLLRILCREGPSEFCAKRGHPYYGPREAPWNLCPEGPPEIWAQRSSSESVPRGANQNLYRK